MPGKSKIDKKDNFSDNFSTYFEVMVGKKTDAIKKGCSTQSIFSLAPELLEILCGHRQK